MLVLKDEKLPCILKAAKSAPASQKKQCKLGPILLKRHKSSWGKCAFLLDMMRACAS